MVPVIDPQTGHAPVLAQETLALLAPRAGDVAVDCTAGRGGHAERLARAVAPPGAAGVVVLFDLDEDNLAAARARVLAAAPEVRCAAFNESFVAAERRVRELGLRASAIVADLGFASTQMDDAARGFSFRADGPLDMRYDRAAPRTAADLLATLTESELAELILRYGEEPLARRIARFVAQERVRRPIHTSAELAELVTRAYGPRARHSRIHPATRTFMALRIAVNEELDALRLLLESIVRGAEHAGRGWLAPEARVAIIGFHSLEDRLVKRAFADLARRRLARFLTKGPVTASPEEVEANPRSRSAKLRAIQLAGPPAH
jgi:16S rRNA (cytosine1402-N4)-methyltransferase